jgi:HEAT repeat protein
VAFATAFGTLLSGAFLVGYMKTLGASDLCINLLAGVPSLVGILQIPGGILGRGVHSYKRFVAPGGLLWRLFYVPVVALPLLVWTHNAKLLFLTLCVTVASMATTFVGPVYNDWIAELIPSGARGFYFARRNGIAAIVGASVGIVGAILLDAFRERGLEKEGFTSIFALALVCGAISWIYFAKMGDLKRPNPQRQSLRDGLAAVKRPFADRKFGIVLLFLGVTMAGQTFPGNLFVAYARESLSLDYKVIQGTAVFMALGNIAAAGAWGFLADKFGNKPLLVFSGLGLCLSPLPWIFCIPGHVAFDAALLLSGHFFIGVTWAGINLCQFNLMLETAAPEDRANYIGAGATVTALVGGVAPLAGGAVMELLRNETSAVAAYRWVFVIAIGLRIIALAFLAPVREPGSRAVKEALRDLTGVTLPGVRALRTLSRASDVGRRGLAIETAGNMGIGLAADEIIKSLHDPLPKIRRQAATALAKINDVRAESELVHQIVVHPDLLEEETIAALGAVGNLEAIRCLIGVLGSPRPLLRRAAARAIGQIGIRLDLGRAPEFEGAIDRLIQIAFDPSDPDLRRAALQGLRFLETDRADEAICDALLDQWPSVRIAATEAIEEMQIRRAAPNLRRSLELFTDEACAEAAYCLGVVGGMSDIPLILQEASRSVSIITRKRCLLGIARLFDVEPGAYRLFLLEGMERDGALQEMLRPRLKRDGVLRDAFSVYSSGNEASAVAALASLDSKLAPLTVCPIEDMFPIAALAYARA